MLSIIFSKKYKKEKKKILFAAVVISILKVKCVLRLNPDFFSQNFC